MLPSGNDAAHQLAEFFGSLLQKDAEDREKKMKADLEKQQKEEEERHDARQKAKREGAEDYEGAKKNSDSNDSQRFLTNTGNLQDKETNAQSSSQSDTNKDGAGADADKKKDGAGGKRAQADTEEQQPELETQTSFKRLDIESVLRKEFPHIKKSPHVAKHS